MVEMTKEDIRYQLDLTHLIARELEDKLNKLRSFCNHVEAHLDHDSTECGKIATPPFAEDIGSMSMKCVREVTRLNLMLQLASREDSDI